MSPLLHFLRLPFSNVPRFFYDHAHSSSLYNPPFFPSLHLSSTSLSSLYLPLILQYLLSLKHIPGFIFFLLPSSVLLSKSIQYPSVLLSTSFHSSFQIHHFFFPNPSDLVLLSISSSFSILPPSFYSSSQIYHFFPYQSDLPLNPSASFLRFLFILFHVHHLLLPTQPSIHPSFL